MTEDYRATASIQNLKARAAILSKTRDFFDRRQFFEVQTPVLSFDIVVDRYLEPITVESQQLGVAATENKTLWLQTSPEFAMKRLLACGAEAIYQIAPCFRGGERGRLHNPEFTMLEWYRVGDCMHSGIELLSEFVESILNTATCVKTSYADAFRTHTGAEVMDTDVGSLKRIANSYGLDTDAFEPSDDIDVWRNLLLTHLVEPNLGKEAPEIIFDWPPSQAALAVVRPGTHNVAERFELYYQGIELANGYHELVDADELSNRNQLNNELRIQDGNRPLPEHSRLLQAMKHGLPQCSGVALGMDRLVMLATNSNSIDQVIPFPIERA